MQQPQIDPQHLITSAGQDALLDWFRSYRDQHGPEWIAEIKSEFPTASWIVELATTKTADEAVREIVKTYPLAAFVAGPIKAFHGRLLEEIERKR